MERTLVKTNVTSGEHKQTVFSGKWILAVLRSECVYIYMQLVTDRLYSDLFVLLNAYLVGCMGVDVFTVPDRLGSEGQKDQSRQLLHVAAVEVLFRIKITSWGPKKNHMI